MNEKRNKFLMQLEKEYSSKGYSISIHQAVPYKKSFILVDLVAKKEKTLAIILQQEFSEQKLVFLKEKFDEVKYIPILEKSEEGYLKHNPCRHIWKPNVKHPKRCPKCKCKLPQVKLKWN